MKALEQYREKSARELSEGAPEELRQKNTEFASSTESVQGKVIAAALTLQEEIKSAKLGTAPFLAAQLSLTWNYSYLVAVDIGHLIQEKISLAAAGNETAMLPIAIQNRTSKTAAYRINVHADADNFNSAECRITATQERK